MAKFNKVYPAFYNGISEQGAELIQDSQCVDMVNCIPNLITGLTKRPPANFIAQLTSQPAETTIVHSYDRGEDEEEYIFLGTGEALAPLKILHKDGTSRTVNYTSDATALKSYLNPSNLDDLKGLTVQDRTFMVNKARIVTETIITPATILPKAFYWASNSSNDKYNPYRYAVYLDGLLVQTDPIPPALDLTTPPKGHEQSDIAMISLNGLINATGTFVSVRKGSILKISRVDGADFTFSSWDSWGSQASVGWKDSISQLSDLPKELGWENEIVEVTGDDGNSFTNYFVKSNGHSWIETIEPTNTRGSLSDMPIAIDRQGDGTFLVSLLSWDTPKVGDIETNPSPSFVGSVLKDLFFYKNRLGIASQSNVVLSETGGYQNFFIKTVLTILDTDPIDIALASTKASVIQYVLPFQSGLFIFTQDSQYELISAGITSPTTVSVEPVSNYPMDVNVQPKVDGSSLFFISTTSNRRQLREYRKNNDTLNVSGVDLNITTPTLLNKPIQEILINGVLGFVFLTTTTNEVYLYNYLDNSNERVQSAWSKWNFYEGLADVAHSFEYVLLDELLVITYKEGTSYNYNTVDLTKDASGISIIAPLYPSEELFPSETLFPGGTSFIDVTLDNSYPYTAKVQLPKWFPHVGQEIGTPKDKILLKKISIEGVGSFDAQVYRVDYNTTYSKTHTTDMRDLDFHVNSKVDRCDIFISDSTTADFAITSVVVEGLFSPSSRTLK